LPTAALRSDVGGGVGNWVVQFEAPDEDPDDDPEEVPDEPEDEPEEVPDEVPDEPPEEELEPELAPPSPEPLGELLLEQAAARTATAAQLPNNPLDRKDEKRERPSDGFLRTTRSVFMVEGSSKRERCGVSRPPIREERRGRVVRGGAKVVRDCGARCWPTSRQCSNM
jgi:hypothetical protein